MATAALISTVAYPAYSATKADHGYRLSDDVVLNVGTTMGNCAAMSECEHLWLVQGVFTTDKKIADNVLYECEIVEPVLICSDRVLGEFTYQMQPKIGVNTNDSESESFTLTSV